MNFQHSILFWKYGFGVEYNNTDLSKTVNDPYKERESRPGEAQGAVLRTTELSEPESQNINIVNILIRLKFSLKSIVNARITCTPAWLSATLAQWMYDRWWGTPPENYILSKVSASKKLLRFLLGRGSHSWWSEWQAQWGRPQSHRAPKQILKGANLSRSIRLNLRHIKGRIEGMCPSVVSM